ncbi:hypothetical protein GGS21DRAFT_103813 [Xylaria nigripes]|nr:hypothetical protein GGS21DRAFT_103813 [Xylaria nigripes]
MTGRTTPPSETDDSSIWSPQASTPTGTCSFRSPSPETLVQSPKPRSPPRAAPTPFNGISSVPEPGRTYMICDMASGRVLTLAKGRLTLPLGTDAKGGWHWECEEIDGGWLGFREVVSGKCLGHDNRGGYMASVDKMDSWESFVLRPRDGGGINLWVKNRFQLMPMGITGLGKNEEEPRLVNAKSSAEATRWEFIRI